MSDYPFDRLPWSPTDSSFDEGRSIGLSEDEFARWKEDPKFIVLEVGTGTNATTLNELRNQGINPIGIEPGLNYPGKYYSGIRDSQNMTKLIKPLMAVDAKDHELLPADGVDVVIAKGANFPHYFKSKSEFFSQLHGVISCIDVNSEHGYLAFELLSPELNLFSRYSEEDVDLSTFLTENKVKYEIRDNEFGIPIVFIYRMNEDGIDLCQAILNQIKN